MTDLKAPAAKPKRTKLVSERVPRTRKVTAELARAGDGKFTDDLASDANGATEAVTHAAKTSRKVYYILNPAGAVHQMTYESAKEKLAIGRGWRVATAAQVAELKKRNGRQTAGDPIGPRWTPEPEGLTELDEPAKPKAKPKAAETPAAE